MTALTRTKASREPRLDPILLLRVTSAIGISIDINQPSNELASKREHDPLGRAGTYARVDRRDD